MNMGRRIEAELTARAWPRARLYELVPGLDDGTLSAIIKRNSRSSKFAPAIADAFGVELHWLLTGEGAKQPRHGGTEELRPALTAAHQLLVQAFDSCPKEGKEAMIALANCMISIYGKSK